MSGTTTNNGWTYPTSTDLVTNGATAIQTLATGIDTSVGTGLLAWQDFDTFTVGGTGWNFGSTATKNGRYVQLGKLIHFDYQITAGGTGIAAGSGGLTLTLPVSANTNTTEFLSNGILSDDSAGINYAIASQISSTTMNIVIHAVSGTNIRYSSLTSTSIPAALATADTLRISGWYEAA